MNRKTLLAIICVPLLAGVLALWKAPRGAGRPAAFPQVSWADATALAAEQGKLLVIDATASWCGPCRLMDTDVWPHADVAGWLRDNAVTFRLDVDEEQALAEQLKIEAMPTVIIRAGDRELGRRVGYQNAVDLLEWFKRSKGELVPGPGAAPPPPSPRGR